MAKKQTCHLCGENIKTTFLDKLIGTIIHGKHVCNACQKEHGDKLPEKISKKE